ncbi:MAG TPA: hypothetical protein VND21_09595, partial [Planctomycetota bacterium]|nr:hypothetical protein [Planctomycetota bacterium]
MNGVLRVAALVLLLAGAAQAAESVAEQRSRFDAVVAAREDAEAQALGKRLLSEFPEDPSALHVLRTFHERDWKWPRLKASLSTLRRWEQEEVDDRAEPDLRLAFVEEIERLFPREAVVRDGGTLYERLWCHLQAKRHDETLRLGKEFLRRFPDSPTGDKVRWAMALAHLARTPPDPESATKLLHWLAENETSRYRDRAVKKLDDLKTGSTWIDLPDGLPRADGLGKIAVVTDLAESDPLWKALEDWRRARAATVVRFRKGRLGDVADDLRKVGPEFVAFAVAPATVDVNFHWLALEVCRSLDDDPLPDVYFGYLTARDAEDLKALAERSLREPGDAAPKVAMVAVPSSAAAVSELDAFLHYGHGTPTGINGGLEAKALGDARLPRAPVVFSGACFNGVLSRSFHASALSPVVQRPAEYAPHDLLSLAWIHAGATGVLAALEGDRGEMAGAEWARWRETAATLGETIGLSYALAFTSLPEAWTGFPRYRVGGARSQSLYDVMLRGQTSRILVGDPAARPVRAPTARPATETRAAWDAASRTLSVSVRIPTDVALAEAQFLFHNTLTGAGMSSAGFTERRLFGRVELPAEVT